MPTRSCARAAAALEQNPIFSALDPGERDAMVDASQLVRYGAGREILTAGDAPRGGFVLLSGAVKVFHASPDGFEVVVKIFKPPAFFGEAELLSNIPYRQCVAAVSDAELLLIPPPVFARLLARCPTVTLAMLRDVCARLCIASDNERSLAFGTVRTRLANYLVWWASTDGVSRAEGVELQTRLTQDDMANALGVTRRAVAKEIARWREAGLIARIGTRYLLPDLAALRREADPANLPLTYTIGCKLDGRQPLG